MKGKGIHLGQVIFPRLALNSVAHKLNGKVPLILRCLWFNAAGGVSLLCKENFWLETPFKVLCCSLESFKREHASDFPYFLANVPETRRYLGQPAKWVASSCSPLLPVLTNICVGIVERFPFPPKAIIDHEGEAMLEMSEADFPRGRHGGVLDSDIWGSWDSVI